MARSKGGRGEERVVTYLPATEAAALLDRAECEQRSLSGQVRVAVREHLAAAGTSSARREAGAEGTLNGGQEVRDAD